MPMPFRPMRRLAVACLVLGLAGLNVATLTLASVHGALSGLVEAVDIRSSRGALVAERDRLAARADRLERRNAALARDLDAHRAETRRLRARTARLAREGRTLRARSRRLDLANDRLRSRVEVQAAHVRRLTGSVLVRLRRVAAANLAAMPLEAVPLVGVATIVGTTAFEMTQLCATARDAADLRRGLGLETGQAGADRVCGLRVPTVEEITAEALGREMDPDALYDACIADLPSYESDPRGWRRCGRILEDG